MSDSKSDPPKISQIPTSQLTSNSLVDQSKYDEFCEKNKISTEYLYAVDLNVSSWQQDMNECEVWSEVKEKILVWQKEFRAITGCDLIAHELSPWKRKKLSQIKEKIYRRGSSDQSLLNKDNLPNMDDLIRIRIETTYLDGVEFLTKKLETYFSSMKMLVEVTGEPRISGYFANHVIWEKPVSFRLAGVSSNVHLKLEIQIATRLATVMWETGHPVYEAERIPDTKMQEKWQWNEEDPRFLRNQLGHMIHLVDGLLVRLRKITAKGPLK